MRLVLVAVIGVSSLLAWCSAVRAESEDVINDLRPDPIEIMIAGQPIETPILKYRLLPTESELQPGNAAPILLRMPWDETAFFSETLPTLQKWETKPLDDPEWKEKGMLSDFYGFFDQMKRAAYRRDAAWEYPIGEKPFNEIMLPDVQGARSFFRAGLVAQSRYHLSRGELDQARETILVGLAIFRHFARTPFLVVQANASANTHAMLERVDEMIGLPGSPNLYWALTALPRPMFDLRPSAELLLNGVEMEMAEVSDLDRHRGAEQWRDLCDKLLKMIADSSNLPPGTVKIDKLALLKYANDTQAQWGGALREDKASITDDEAIVRCFMWENRRISQQGTALMCLPPHQAIPALRQFDRQKVADYQKMGIPGQVASDQVMQGLDMYVFVWSVQRKIDALRVVEAIRAHLPAHGDRLPEKLADITDLSLPVDPLTNQPFGWKVSGHVGRLSAATIPGVSDRTSAAFEYVLRVR